MKKPKKPGSWEPVSRWYDSLVGEKGHYYHQNVILPNVLRLLPDSEPYSLLDLACGQGVLARRLKENVSYTGVDISPSFIKSAQKQGGKGRFITADATKKLSLEKEAFDWAACILAIQDMENAEGMIRNAAFHLKKGGRLLIVMNHPCFRIPRASSWLDDPVQKMRYRRLSGYLSPLAIPIQTEPSKGGRSKQVVSYHRPLSLYFKWLADAGFSVEAFEEWISDKKSGGARAKMENRAREEFPLFACLVAILN